MPHCRACQLVSTPPCGRLVSISAGQLFSKNEGLIPSPFEVAFGLCGHARTLPYVIPAKAEIHYEGPVC
jgi:hypothetical protein